MTIGVVIVTYNSNATIMQCIKSVIAEHIQDIVVVDSLSQDDTLHKIVPGCTVISLRSNKGFAYAANQGASVLNTDYVLFLNPDAVLVPGTIDILQNVLLSCSNLGIVGCSLIDQEGRHEVSSYGREPTLLNTILRHIEPEKQIQRTQAVDWVSGAALLVRSNIFTQLHGFDESFFLYWEDVDLCKRVREMGYKVYVAPGAKVRHIRGGSRLDSRKKTELYDESAHHYFHKHYPPLICKMHDYLRILYRLLRPLAR